MLMLDWFASIRRNRFVSHVRVLHFEITKRDSIKIVHALGPCHLPYSLIHSFIHSFINSFIHASCEKLRVAGLAELADRKWGVYRNYIGA